MSTTKFLVVAALAMVYSFSATPGQAQTINLNQIWQADNDAIVRIDVIGTDRSGVRRNVAYGNGIIIDPLGRIITALHVVGRATDWQDTGNGTVDRIVHVVWRDRNGAELGWVASVTELPQFDIAVLQINASNLPSVAVDPTPVSPFSSVALLLWDKPAGSTPISPRLISGQLTTPDPGRDGDKISIVANVTEGNSGAPVFNAKGELIAILTSQDPSRGLALAVPIAEFVPTFVRPPPPKDRDQPPTESETVANKLNAFVFYTSTQEMKPGIRKWTRVANNRWQEEYPDGTKQINLTVKRINFRGCNGTVVYDPITNPNFQALLPDRDCMNMVFFFRQSPADDWTAYAQMTAVR